MLKIYTVFNPGPEGVVHSYLGRKGKSSWVLEGSARNLTVLSNMEKRGYYHLGWHEAITATGVPFKSGREGV